jgi:4-hydroxybenzoate polyprenyltransferase
MGFIVLNVRTMTAVLGDIKLAHTVFALPFALMAAVLALSEVQPTPDDIVRQTLLVVVCMFGARTWAMAINRWADAHFDKLNPRTSARALPAGRASSKAMLGLALFGAVLFVMGAALLSPLALACALPVLGILASYSFAKRATVLCHFWLGLCLGLAPMAAWLAIRGTIHPPLVTLGTAILFWVGGFDIVYALQDMDFDRRLGLRSLPAAFGTERALQLARAAHAAAVVLFAIAFVQLGLGPIALAGVGLAGVLMLWQHIAIARHGHHAIPFAFFQLNAWVAIGMFATVLLDITFRKGLLS